MKLEIDLTDRSQLLKAKGDLKRLLDIVNFALDQSKNGSERTMADVAVNAISDSPVMNVVHSLPTTFTTSDVIIGMGESGKEQRGAIKTALTRAVEHNLLRIVELGRGR